MKFTITLAVAVASIAGIPLLAQDSGADASAASPGNDSAKVTYAPAAGGFGDLSASHAWEMSPVTGELDGKLDSKAARVGDRVVLKTMDKVQASDGTVIPRGSRVVGHVTEVQAYDSERGPARIAIAFDHAELKNGQSIAIYTLIRGVNLGGSAIGTNHADDGAMVTMPIGNPGRVGGGPPQDSSRGIGLTSGSGGLPGGPAERDGGAGSASDRMDTNPGSVDNSTAKVHGGLNADTGAHAVAATRAVPRATQIRGVMLAGNSSSSGVFLSLIRNIQFESGTEIQLGVATGR